MTYKYTWRLCGGLFIFFLSVQADQLVEKEDSLNADLEITQSDIGTVKIDTGVLQVAMNEVNSHMTPCCVVGHDSWWNNTDYVQYAVATAVILPLIGWLSHHSFSSFYSSSFDGFPLLTLPE